MTTSDNYYQTNMNAHMCPLCGSDMRRNKEDDPMDQVVENCICMNPECNVEATFTSQFVI